MKIDGKRGLSPVVATVLLIGLAVLIGLIIYFWAVGFFGENIQKQGTSIKNFCDKIDFEAEISRNQIDSGILAIANNGNVPIEGVLLKIRSGDSYETQKKSFGQTVKGGESLTGQALDFTVQVDSEIIAYPIIVGEEGNYKKEYICEDAVSERTVNVI